MKLAFATERISWKARHILPRLAEEFDLTLITYSCADEIPHAGYRRIIRVPPRNHEMLPGTAFQMSSAIDRLCEQGEADLAYVYSSIACLVRRCPFVNVLNGSFWESCRLCLQYGHGLHKLRSLTGYLHYALPEEVACRRADRIITVSQSLARFVARRYRRRPHDIYTVLNGLGDEYRDLYNPGKFSAKPVGVLYSGRLHFQKGITPLVEALVRRPSIPIRLYICGDGPDRGRLAELAARDSRITLLGHVDRQTLMDCLKNTSVYLFPSLGEGFGLSLTEAMASGHACLVYDIPVNRELLGEAGIYAPYNQPAQMIDALDACVSTPLLLQRAAEAASQMAARFSWARCADDMIGALRAIHQDVTAARPVRREVIA